MEEISSNENASVPGLTDNEVSKLIDCLSEIKKKVFNEAWNSGLKTREYMNPFRNDMNHKLVSFSIAKSQYLYCNTLTCFKKGL